MNPSLSAPRNYLAFISYRHLPLDREAAVRIQKKIENYAVPKEYRERAAALSGRPDGKKLGVCFRDEDELPASSSLSDSITYALDHTEYLIVICTPDLPQSRWCLEEVRYFLQTHDRDHVLAVLADGTPEQSFPRQLRFLEDESGNVLSEVEPLAANVAGEGHRINNKTFKKEVTRLIAAMLGCPFDALWQRERRARTNRLLAAAGVVFAAMAVFIGVVLSKNAQISEQNQTITAKNRELEQKMSTALVDAGLAQLQNYDRKGALQSALSALENEDPEIYDHRAEKLLADALGAYSGGTPQYNLMLTQSTNIERIAFTEDGQTALETDKVGNIRALDVRDGTILWDTFLNTSEAPWLYPVGNELVLCKADESLTALSAGDGSVLWSYEYNLPNPFQVISDDRSLFAVLDSTVSGYEYYSEYGSGGSKTVDMNIYVLNTATGEIVSTLEFPDDPYHIYVNTSDRVYEYGGDFSDDNSCLAAALPTQPEDRQTLLFFKGDLTKKEVSCIGTYGSHPDMILGLALSADQHSCYAALTDSKVLYSVIVYEDPDRESAVTEIDYSMSSAMGMDSLDYSNVGRPFLPMLTSDHLVLLFSRNDVYVIDRADGTLRLTLDLDSPIVTACWLDREKEHLELLTQRGMLCSYDLGYGTGMLLNEYRVQTLPVTDISVAGRYYRNSDSMYTDYLLAVSSAQPGHLLGLVQNSDPNYVSGGTHAANCTFAVMTPSKERVMYFFPVAGDSGSILVEVVDVKTGEVLKQANLSLSPLMLPVLGISSRPLAVDDEHFLIFGAIFGLDGSITTIEPEKHRLEFLADVQNDGSVLYGYETDADVTGSPDSNPSAFACLLDGVPVEGCTTLEKGIVMDIEPDDLRPHYFIGKNGWIAGWGHYMTANKDAAGQAPDRSEQTKVVIQNLKTGEKTEIRDDLVGVPVTHMVFAHKTSRLACVYENGAVALYDLEAGDHGRLDSSYAKGEVQNLCWSDTDEHLLVLTVNGRVDCFRADTGEKLASLSHCFAASDSDLIDWFTAAEDAANGRLILTAANETGKNDPIDYYKAKYWTTVIDTASWETTAQPDNVCFWSVTQGQAVIANGRETGVCKVHTLKDLTEWARSELEK